MTTPIASETELPALKPCPFCNRDSDLRVGEWLRGKWFVSCNGCDADGPMGRKREEAVAAWNRRAALSSRSGSAAETAGWIMRLEKALKWYRDEAVALSKHMPSGAHTQAVLASLTVLSLDGGRRADAAMGSDGNTEGEKG